ncbi:MAG: TlpA family protein disulfide reductase [Deltaproteobacteria bacterium]|nr:TlpA family protein disulfide reductase [Deltaproteobacteria bacterium]
MKRFLRAYGVVLALAVGGLWLWVHSRAARPDLPEIAPPLVLFTPSGERWSLSELSGRPVVINFWASWCDPCRVEVPQFAAFSAARPDVPVLGVALRSGSPDQVAEAARRFGISYPVLVSDEATDRAWDVSTLPTTVVVAPDGRVASVHVGTMDQPAIERAVAAAEAPTPAP